MTLSSIHAWRMIPLSEVETNLVTSVLHAISFARCVSQLTLSIECPWAGVSVGLWVGVDSGVGKPIVCTSGRHVRSSLGTVDVNMSRMQRHALCHMSEENWEPLETTRFSRQLVPDLASCSLSVERNKKITKTISEVISRVVVLYFSTD